ncbi:MAG TPA: hybrid sensor histidine kinase/response regulator [Stellaceae bacterium]|nr:hybrid sensor histidine kinase/response regulator [Stellaceae bacterium]
MTAGVASARAVTGVRILIVDDDGGDIETARAILRRGGFMRVEAASDAAGATQLCRSLGPDLLLLAYRMSEAGGLEILERLRADLPDLDPAAILTIAERDGDVRTLAYEHGVRDWVAKPFHPRELLARVAAAAECRELGRNLEAAVAERMARHQEAIAVLRQAEGALRRNLETSEAGSRAKSGLLAETVHELRTPLNAICGYSETLQLGIFGPIENPKHAEYVRLINEAAQHLRKIVDGLLDYSSAESESATLNIGRVDVGALVRETADLLRSQAEAGGVKLEVAIDPGLAAVHTDATKLRQVILNLGSNAVKYTPRGGRVAIEAKPDGGGGALVLIIRDTGIGMGPGDIEVAMRPFGRVKRDPKAAAVQGTGLGLPLTKRYVELLGGTLEIQSKPGRGTVVTVWLPADAPARRRA